MTILSKIISKQQRIECFTGNKVVAVSMNPAEWVDLNSETGWRNIPLEISGMKIIQNQHQDAKTFLFAVEVKI